jgi:hypothetical protein
MESPSGKSHIQSKMARQIEESEGRVHSVIAVDRVDKSTSRSLKGGEMGQTEQIGGADLWLKRERGKDGEMMSGTEED